jgi:hypothetical protein
VSLPSLAQRAGALLLLAGAVVTPLSRRIQRADERLDDVSGSEATPGQPLAARLIVALGRLPGLGRFLAPPVAAVIAGAIVTLTSREDTARTIRFSHRVTILMAFAAAWLFPGFQLIVASAGMMATVADVGLAGRSSHAAASWVFFTTPVAPGQAARAIRLAVGAQSILLPVLLVSILALATRPPGTALWVIALYALGLRGIVAVTAAVQPAAPLARQQRTGSPLTATLVGLLFSVPYGVVVAVIDRRAADRPAVAVVLLVIAATTAVLHRIAASRAARLPYDF